MIGPHHLRAVGVDHVPDLRFDTPGGRDGQCTLWSMTTVDTPGAAPVTSWVARAEQRAHRFHSTVDVRRLLLAVLFAVPLALGWTAGLVVRAGVYLWAGLVEGYTAGRGPLRVESGQASTPAVRRYPA